MMGVLDAFGCVVVDHDDYLNPDPNHLKEDKFPAEFIKLGEEVVPFAHLGLQVRSLVDKMKSERFIYSR